MEQFTHRGAVSAMHRAEQHTYGNFKRFDLTFGMASFRSCLLILHSASNMNPCLMLFAVFLVAFCQGHNVNCPVLSLVGAVWWCVCSNYASYIK